MLLRKDIFLFS